MRVYQMTAEEIANELATDLNNGKFNEDISQTPKNKALLSQWVRGIAKEIRSKFLLIDLLSAVCYFITLVFSILNQNIKLTWLSIGAIILTLASYLGTGALIYSYRRRFQRRLKETARQNRVVRSGQEIEIFAGDLAVGDLILLEEGTVLHGDARIVEEEDLFADERLVFSGSIPAQKSSKPIAEENLAPEEQINMLWKGSYITAGKGRAIITALGEDCYIEKTGGRDSVKQRSWFFNKQKNIGHISSYLYIILLAICSLISLIATARFSEAILLMGVMGAVVMLNPFSIVTEWSYYRTAENLFREGALIRNIEAFDGMNREKALYYSADELLQDSLKYHSIEPLEADYEACLSHLALCLGNHSISKLLDKPLKDAGIHREALDREFPNFRSEIDEQGNRFSIFAGEDRSVAVAAGYWETMLPFIRGNNESLLARIREIESTGRMVWLISSKGIHAIPNQLNPFDYEGAMAPMGILIFDLIKKEDLAEKIKELQHSKMKVYLVSDYHKRFGDSLAEFYEMNGVVSTPPEEPCYTLPHLINNPNVVTNQALPIMQENAKLLLFGEISPQEVIYRVKCMFCGIKRSMGFIVCFGALLIISALILFLREIPLEKIVIPVLLLRPVMAAVCYYLVETVGNCNQYKRSLLLGALCGFVGFAAALLGFDIAFLGMFLSSLLICAVCLFTVRKMRNLRRKDFVVLLIALLAVILPWFFMGGNIVAAILFALFPPISSYIINLFY